MAKYKVLLADDEYWAREKIRNMIQWENYSLEFLEPAKDGEQVLEKLERCRPDILITDINMPFVNGVELLGILQEKYADIVTFVISGYDDFEYVKGTFLAGAINYLIKPVNKFDLVDALSRALEIISKRQASKEALLKAASMIQDSEYSQLLEREDTCFAAQGAIGGSLDFSRRRMVFVKLHHMKKLSEAYQYDRSLLSWSIKKQILQSLECSSPIIFNHIYHANEFIAVTKMEGQALSRSAARILRDMEALSKGPVTVVVSEGSSVVNTIYKGYIQAATAWMARPFSRASVLLSCGQEKVKQAQAKPFGCFEGASWKELEKLLAERKKDAVKKLAFGGLGFLDGSVREWEYLQVKQAVRHLVSVAVDTCTPYRAAEALIAAETLAEFVDKALETLDVALVWERMEEFLDEIMYGEPEGDEGSIKDIVKKAAKYVDENYFEELTLSALSKRFHVGHSYFSRMFRKEMGETLMSYISKVRVEKAKALIRQGMGNLTEVAFLVGYSDYTYFSRVFRKVAGVSPSDYRAQVSSP